MASLVGYTNAGKSTLFNTISKAGVTSADRLFATLDPVTRRIRLPHGDEILVTDTVGFINKLPPAVISAFHATLEFLQDADLLLHVVDRFQPRQRRPGSGGRGHPAAAGAFRQTPAAGPQQDGPGFEQRRRSSPNLIAPSHRASIRRHRLEHRRSDRKNSEHSRRPVGRSNRLNLPVITMIIAHLPTISLSQVIPLPSPFFPRRRESIFILPIPTDPPPLPSCPSSLRRGGSRTALSQNAGGSDC